MKRSLSMFIFTLIFAIGFSSVSMASSYVSLIEVNREAKNISGKVMTLVQEGAADQVDKLPEVQKLKEELNRNPELSNQYLASLDAVKALKSGKLHIDVDDGKSKLVKFDDGSFISVSSTHTIIDKPAHNTNIQEGNVFPMDPPGIIYQGKDDYKYEIWGLYKVAELHLVTFFEYGQDYVKITDTSTSASVNVPAWLVSRSSSIISDTKSKASFEMRDPVGSFTANLYTTIIPGNFTYDVVHSND